jgi:restriction endonuclease Mrr
MPIPETKVLLLPVLRVLGDGAEHKTVEIRQRVKVQFDVAPQELQQKTRKGILVFHNRVALALANLQGTPHGHSRAINKVRKEVYKITEHGMAILKRNPSALTINDL